MLPGDYTEAVLVSRNLDIPAIMKDDMTATDPVLPEDPELALNFLGTIAEKERKLAATHREVLDLRNRAIAELCSPARRDINVTRASIRMIMSRQRLYEIRDEQVRKAG